MLSNEGSIRFEVLCQLAAKREFERAESGEITRLTAQLFVARLKNHLIPAFSGCHVHEISQQRVNDFAETLQRKFRRATAKQILFALRKLLKLAHAEGHISKLPEIPILKTDSVPRGAFSAKEYLAL